MALCPDALAAGIPARMLAQPAATASTITARPIRGRHGMVFKRSIVFSWVTVTDSAATGHTKTATMRDKHDTAMTVGSIWIRQTGTSTG